MPVVSGSPRPNQPQHHPVEVAAGSCGLGAKRGGEVGRGGFANGFRGHNTGYGNLRRVEGRPPCCGVRQRPTTPSKRSRKAVLPSARPVRACSRIGRSSVSERTLFRKARQSGTIASKGSTFTSGAAVRHPRYHQPCEPCHARSLAMTCPSCQYSYCVPGIGVRTTPLPRRARPGGSLVWQLPTIAPRAPSPFLLPSLPTAHRLAAPMAGGPLAVTGE